MAKLEGEGEGAPLSLAPRACTPPSGAARLLYLPSLRLHCPGLHGRPIPFSASQRAALNSTHGDARSATTTTCLSVLHGLYIGLSLFSTSRRSPTRSVPIFIGAHVAARRGQGDDEDKTGPRIGPILSRSVLEEGKTTGRRDASRSQPLSSEPRQRIDLEIFNFLRFCGFVQPVSVPFIGLPCVCFTRVSLEARSKCPLVRPSIT